MVALALLGAQVLHGQIAGSTQAAADRRELAALMTQLWARSGVPVDGADTADPAEAKRLVAEIAARMRHQKPAPAPAAPAGPPPPLRKRRGTPPGGTIKLSLPQFMRRVRGQNDQIVSNRLEFEIAGQGILGARSVFELQFVGTGLHEENRTRNTVEQALQRTSQADFEEFNERWDAAFEKLLPTGTKIRVGYHLDDLNNSLQRLGTGIDTFNEFRSFTGLTVTQPILKGAGRKANGAKIRIAEKDADIAFQVYRREMLRILAEAGAAYWELARSRQRIKIFRKSVQIAEKLVTLNEQRAASGLIPESELLEARVGLALRRSQTNEAQRDLGRATNRVRSFLYRSPLDDARAVATTEKLVPEPVSSNLADHLSRARAHAPEYIIARTKAIREGIREEFAINQRQPQLDLKSAYGVNGLDVTTDRSNEDAFSNRHPSWNIGFEFRVPLEGGMQSAADLEIAHRKRCQALIEIRTVEVELSNALDSGLKAVKLTAQQMVEHEGMVATRRSLLETEISRLEKGLSTSRAVLQRDDDLNRILEDQLEASVSHEKAVLAFEVTRGTLLERFDLDVRGRF